MKLYLAGPMRGIKDFNFPAFKEHAEQLRLLGYEVFSPAEKGEEILLTDNPGIQENLAFRRKVFAIDTDWICNHADGIAMMPGWEASSGARAEHALALAIGLHVRYL